MSEASRETYKVVIELDKRLEPNDIDFLNLFLESRKQSGGGDIRVSKLNQDLQSLHVFYEDKEAQERVINKRFLRFKSYQLRASLTGCLENDEADLVLNQFILSSLPNEFFARIFAENLQPHAELTEIKQSTLFAHTYYATFSSSLDRELLEKRFQTRTNNNSIKLFDSYDTNSCLLKSANKIDLTQLKSHLDQLYGEAYFLKSLNDQTVVLQAENLKNTTNWAEFTVQCEYIYNYKLINDNEKTFQVAETTTQDSLLELTDSCAEALLNARQLFINFEENLKKLDKNLKLVQQTRTICVKNQGKPPLDPQWKQKCLNELRKYFTTRAQQKSLKIPNEILSNLQSLQQLVSKINKECPAVYLRLDASELVCYGTKNALLNKLQEVSSFFSSKTNNSPTVASTPTNESFCSIEIEQNCTIYKCLQSIPQIFHDFKNNLIKDYNADLLKEDKKMMVKSITADLDYNQWSARIKGLLDDYEKNRLRLKKIQIAPNLRRPKELDDLRKHCEHFFAKEKTLKFELMKSNECIQVYGYASQVKTFTDNVQSKFSNLENNIKDRIRRKLDVKLEQQRMPVLAMLSSNNAYLKDFNNQLNKLEALAELTFLNNKLVVRIKTTLSAQRQQNEQQVEQWRNKIDSFVVNYFGLFVMKRVKLPCKKQEFKYDLSKSNAKLVWLDGETVELTGLKADVDKLENELIANNETRERKQSLNSNKENSIPKLMSRSRNVSETKTTSSETETFLISDLKWFQTRMLFEKKYFLFITEMYKDLSVLVDTQLTRIYYSGTRKDIEDAKKLAFDILDRILGTEVESSPEMNEKITANETRLLNLLKQNGVCCIIDAKSNLSKYTIYSVTCEEIEKCRSLLENFEF